MRLAQYARRMKNTDSKTITRKTVLIRYNKMVLSIPNRCEQTSVTKAPHGSNVSVRKTERTLNNGFWDKKLDGKKRIVLERGKMIRAQISH